MTTTPPPVPANPLDDRWLTPDEVGRMLAVSKSTVYRMCAADELRWIRVGRFVRISEVGLARWIAEGGSDPDVAHPQNPHPHLQEAL